MKQTITRRDFLNGAALALGAGAALSPLDLLHGALGGSLH